MYPDPLVSIAKAAQKLDVGIEQHLGLGRHLWRQLELPLGLDLQLLLNQSGIQLLWVDMTQKLQQGLDHQVALFGDYNRHPLYLDYYGEKTAGWS